MNDKNLWIGWAILTAIIWALLYIDSQQLAYGAEPPRVLSLNFNDNVKVLISNAPCPHKELKAKYPNAAAAIRIDNQALSGCFTHEGDLIVIQWYRGDQSKFLANQFLMPQESDL